MIVPKHPWGQPASELLPPDRVVILLAWDREEIERFSALIRKFSRVPAAMRDKRTARMLDYWKHVRGYLRWRVAHLTHPGKESPRESA